MKRTEKVEVKLTVEEKQFLDGRAKTVGTTKSNLIRKLLADDKRIIVLGESREILSALYQVHNDLKQCLGKRSFDILEANKVTEALNKIGVTLCEIARIASDLSDGEDEEDVDSENG